MNMICNECCTRAAPPVEIGLTLCVEGVVGVKVSVVGKIRRRSSSISSTSVISLIMGLFVVLLDFR